MTLTVTSDPAAEGKLSYFPSLVSFSASQLFFFSTVVSTLFDVGGRRALAFSLKPLKYFLWLAPLTPEIPHPPSPRLASLRLFSRCHPSPLPPSPSVKQLDGLLSAQAVIMVCDLL